MTGSRFATYIGSLTRSFVGYFGRALMDRMFYFVLSGLGGLGDAFTCILGGVLSLVAGRFHVLFSVLREGSECEGRGK